MDGVDHGKDSPEPIDLGYVSCEKVEHVSMLLFDPYFSRIVFLPSHIQASHIQIANTSIESRRRRWLTTPARCGVPRCCKHAIVDLSINTTSTATVRSSSSLQHPAQPRHSYRELTRYIPLSPRHQSLSLHSDPHPWAAQLMCSQQVRGRSSNSPVSSPTTQTTTLMNKEKRMAGWRGSAERYHC